MSVPPIQTLLINLTTRMEPKEHLMHTLIMFREAPPPSPPPETIFNFINIPEFLLSENVLNGIKTS